MNCGASHSTEGRRPETRLRNARDVRSERNARPARNGAWTLAVVLLLLGPAAMAGQDLRVRHFAGSEGGSGSADGSGSSARFGGPFHLAVDTAGTVYVADGTNCTIRRITAAGVVTTLAGLAGTQGSADGSGSTARFNVPLGVAVDATGTVFVADT